MGDGKSAREPRRGRSNSLRCKPTTNVYLATLIIYVYKSVLCCCWLGQVQIFYWHPLGHILTGSRGNCAPSSHNNCFKQFTVKIYILFCSSTWHRSVTWPMRLPRASIQLKRHSPRWSTAWLTSFDRRKYDCFRWFQNCIKKRRWNNIRKNS